MDFKKIKNDAQRLAEDLVSDALTGKHVTPSNNTSDDDIKRFRKLQAQEAWLQMNKQTLDRMEKRKNSLLRILVLLSLVNLLLTLLNYLLL